MDLKIAWLITSSETARTRDAAVDIAEFFPFSFFFLFFFLFPGARFGYRFYSVAVEFNCLLINARPIINSRQDKKVENYDRSPLEILTIETIPKDCSLKYLIRSIELIFKSMFEMYDSWLHWLNINNYFELEIDKKAIFVIIYLFVRILALEKSRVP